MDSRAFDDLVRSMAASRSRRTMLELCLGGIAALHISGANARKKRKKKPCDPCRIRKKGKCKGAKLDGTACPGGTCQQGACRQQTTTTPPPPPPATCTDGIKNGRESDIDCGGPDCPRCANGWVCGSRTDCASDLCVNGVCQACTSSPQCGSGTGGVTCVCTGGVCTNPVSETFDTCQDCPPGSNCYGTVDCWWLCTAP